MATPASAAKLTPQGTSVTAGLVSTIVAAIGLYQALATGGDPSPYVAVVVAGILGLVGSGATFTWAHSAALHHELGVASLSAVTTSAAAALAVAPQQPATAPDAAQGATAAQRPSAPSEGLILAPRPASPPTAAPDMAAPTKA